MDNGCDHFWNGFECCVNSLVPQNHKTHTPWLCGGWQPWCCPFAMKHNQHSTKVWETLVHELQEEEQRENGVKGVILPSKNTPFSLFNHCFGFLFTRSQSPFPFFQWWLYVWKRQHKCDECVVLGNTWWWVFGWCWWATISHFTTTTPTMCAFLLFTHCAFHSHPPHKWFLCDCTSNGVLSYSTNAKCHPPLSLTKLSPHLYLPFHHQHIGHFKN